MTLARDPNIAIEETRLQSSRGALEVAAGAFDPVLNSTLTQADARTPLSTTSRKAASGRPSTEPQRIVTAPPPGVYFTALSTRLPSSSRNSHS